MELEKNNNKNPIEIMAGDIFLELGELEKMTNNLENSMCEEASIGIGSYLSIICC